MNRIRRALTTDAALTAMCAFAGVWLGMAYTRMPPVIATAAYYQGSMAPSVLLACGRGFTNLARVPDREQEYAPLLDFLGQRADRFDCQSLPSTITEVPFTALQAASRYLLLAIGVAWKIGGVSWSGVSWFYGVVYGTVAALAFAASRALVGRAAALALTGVFITSAAQLGNLPHFRDYLKVPFFLAMLLILLRVVARPLPQRRLLLWSAAAGAVTGIGFGVRFDMVVFLAFFLGAVLVMSPGSPRLTWRPRLLAVAAAIAAFFVTALPILLAFQLGNNSWHVVILGFSDQHESPLGLRRMYQIGTLYYDGYVAATVNSFWQRQTGSDALFLLDSPEYGQAGAAYFRALAQMFPADLVARAWACVPALARLGFDAVPLPHAFVEGSLLDRVIDLRMAVTSRLPRLMPWLPLLPLAVSVAVAAWNVRLALLAVSAWLFFGAVSSLQYQARHVVHLEILSLLLTVVALDWAARAAWRALRRNPAAPDAPVPAPRLLPVVALTAALAVVFVAPLVALRAVQQPIVRNLLESYSARLPQERSFLTEPRDDRTVLVTPRAAPAATASPLRTQFFAADFDAARCPFDRVTATIRYATSRRDNDFSRRLDVAVPESGAARAWFAAYDFDDAAGIDSYRFAGLELPASQVPCLSALAAIEGVESEQLLIDAVLPPQWEHGKLYAIFKRWESDPINPLPRLNYTIPDGLPVRSLLGGRAVTPFATAIDYQDGIVTIDDDHRIVARGSTNPVGYLASWQPTPAVKAALLAAEGEVFAGGLTIGLELDGMWAAQVQITAVGPFRAVIEVPRDGEFRPVVANLSGQSRMTRFQIDRIGWVQ